MIKNKFFLLKMSLPVIGFSGLVVASLLFIAKVEAFAGLAMMTSFVLLAISAHLSKRFKSIAFTVWVLAFASCAFFFPNVLISFKGFELKRLIAPLIQVIMLGMGMTLTVADFTRVLRMPKAVLIGVCLQYSVMPIMGWLFASIFGLPPEVAVGLILVGSCPGGTASNVIAYIAGVNVALSVTMTACSTLLSPVLTPLAMKLIAGRIVPIFFFPMMISIFKMIIIPIILGLIINRYMHKFAKMAVKVFPAVCMIAICMIIGITISLSRDDLLSVGMILFGASVCHNAVGFGLGYGLARLFGMNKTDAKTVSIEVGMQNGGLATGLAFNVLKSTAAAMPSAVFGPWSAVSGSALASWWRRKLPSLRE